MADPVLAFGWLFIAMPASAAAGIFLLAVIGAIFPDQVRRLIEALGFADEPQWRREPWTGATPSQT